MTKIVRTGVLRALRPIAGAAAVLFSVHAAALAQSAEDTSNAAANSVKLVRVVIGLPPDTAWLTLRHTIFCVNPLIDKWPGGRIAQRLPPYYVPFQTELERAGYKVVTPGEDNLFNEESGSADYEAAAVVTDQHVDGCGAVGNTFVGDEDITGEGTMKIDWQLYSRVRKEVVAHISTSGTAKLDHKAVGGVAKLVRASFADNVRALGANAEFRAALNGPKALAKGVLAPGQHSKIILAGSLKAGPRPIADAVGSVVTLITGTGSGSGVLVSQDGYFLTNAHVVGDDTTIRARWSDGIETIAQVVRVAKDRDIALVKTNPRERMPLAIKHGAVTPGQRVYAIGSPKGKAFQGTVSSGVVSATRIIDGLRYIQSDVSISPGSSGGALLDETGSVIGIAVLRFENDGPAGLNMFVPVGDAMDFLSLEQQ